MIVKNGYIKMLALLLSDLDTKIIDERHTNDISDVKTFKENYDDKPNVKVFLIHMDNQYDLTVSDYQKILPDIHPGDYIRNLLKTKNGYIIEGSDMGYNIKHEYLEEIASEF